MAKYLDWSSAKMKATYAAGHRCSNPTQIMLGKPTGVVRVSLGAISTASDVHTLIRFLDDHYCNSTNQQRTSTSHVSLQGAPLSPPASPGPNSVLSPHNIPHALYVPPQQTRPGPTPDTAGSRDIPENAIWESTPLPQQQSPLTVEPERAKYPPFNPQDYINMRKQNPQSYDVGMEIKVRELEDSSMFSRNQPPSVKAWKFGRSVVSLLRTKSHFADSTPARDVTIATS